jgi:hypothetical protein
MRILVLVGVDLRHELAEWNQRGLGSLRAEELPDREEHHDQQDPE